MKFVDDDILWCNADMAWTQKGYWKSGKRRKQSDILWRVPRRLSLVMMIVTKIRINLDIHGFLGNIFSRSQFCHLFDNPLFKDSRLSFGEPRRAFQRNVKR